MGFTCSCAPSTWFWLTVLILASFTLFHIVLMPLLRSLSCIPLVVVLVLVVVPVVPVVVLVIVPVVVLAVVLLLLVVGWLAVAVFSSMKVE